MAAPALELPKRPFAIDEVPEQADATPAPPSSDTVESERVLCSFRRLDFTGAYDLVQQIAALASGEEEDDYGILKPTRYALARTFEVLRHATRQVIYNQQTSNGPPFPRGSVTTDERGGIRIEWKAQPGQAVRLAIPASSEGRSYIYWETGGTFATEKVSGSTLAHLLRLVS